MFMSFLAMVDRQFSQTIKIVQSDNGTNLIVFMIISMLLVSFSKLHVQTLHNKMGG